MEAAVVSSACAVCRQPDIRDHSETFGSLAVRGEVWQRSGGGLAEVWMPADNENVSERNESRER